MQENQNEQGKVKNEQKNKNKLLQYLLASRQLPSATYPKTICFYALSACILMTLSVISFVIVSGIRQQSFLYYAPFESDSVPQCKTGQTCSLQIELSQSLRAPIYFMYQLDDFYQNHRRYIQSKSNYQLAGNVITKSYEAEVCWPYATNQQMGVSSSWGGSQLSPEDIASPCGAIALTYFNDTYKLYNQTAYQILINETQITWPGDKGHKYKQAPNSAQTQWIDPENQHFIVWMRTAGLSDFKKLWGRIEQDLPAGKYSLTVQNNFNSSAWEGNRYIYLTENSILGGKNFFIPVMFLILGLGCLAITIFFVIRWKSEKLRNN